MARTKSATATDQIHGRRDGVGREAAGFVKSVRGARNAKEVAELSIARAERLAGRDLRPVRDDGDALEDATVASDHADPIE